MFYNYKAYPHSKAATRLSAIGKGLLVTGLSSTLLLFATTILPEFIDTGHFATGMFLVYALLAAFFVIIGVSLMAIAKRVALKAEQNISNGSEKSSEFVSQNESYATQTAPQGDLQPNRFENEADAQKYIKQRLLTNKKGLVILLFMVAALIVSLYFGLFSKDSSKESAIAFKNTATSDNYYYSDVVCISNWLYKYDYGVYYIAQDASSQTFVLKMTDVDFEKLSAQYQYFLSTDENAAPPEPYRIYGVTTNTSDDLEKNICESTGIKATEFSKNFGKCYLDTTTSPAKENSSLWLVAALILGLLSFALAIGWFTRLRNLHQSIAILKEAGQLIPAATELSSYSETQFGKKTTAFVSAHYLFSSGMCIVVLLTDIILCYKKPAPAGEFFCVYTKKWKDRPVASNSGKSGIFEKWLEYILTLNPEILVGKSYENLARYNSKRDS